MHCFSLCTNFLIPPFQPFLMVLKKLRLVVDSELLSSLFHVLACTISCPCMVQSLTILNIDYLASSAKELQQYGIKLHSALPYNCSVHIPQYHSFQQCMLQQERLTASACECLILATTNSLSVTDGMTRSLTSNTQPSTNCL